MDRFNRADKTLCVLFVCFLVVLALRTLYPHYIIFELLFFWVSFSYSYIAKP